MLRHSKHSEPFFSSLLVTIMMQVSRPKGEPTFRQVPITGQHISSHAPAVNCNIWDNP